ncbi:MAG: PEP-CTERM sorting domain-containing protein [Paludisphaera borealis]|uniref:PEP-CTERM sorting domain-containing protein n=1 Tax=Paludisphaera borealis TaxID=1387353 RepID=UPI002840DD5D|nr:PEP-CTERM sorting domain-containing protein [Paludisphaera borealis]MDR3620169.1 PEP-CTERM sorting domain-containing protein [Paludisphaera borealis]
MGRIAWLVGLAWLTVFGNVDRAQASPLKLAFSGGAFGAQIRTDNPYATIDVTNEFSRFGQEGEAGVWVSSPEGTPEPVNSSIDVTATLSDADRILATVQFSGSVTGVQERGPGSEDISGYAHGSATGVVTIAPGVDPGQIPSWLTGMTATLSSFVSGGPSSLTFPAFYSTLLITPGDPTPVPEPSSVLVFLAAVGCVGYRRLRRA